MDYSEVYTRYYDKISRYLAGIVGPLEAQDLAQEVFMKVGSNLDKLKDSTKLSSWIFEIALRTAKDRLRHNSSTKSTGIHQAKPGGYFSSAAFLPAMSP